jgi:cellulose biosynthesis protein BcsQ
LIIAATEYGENMADFLSTGLPDDIEVAVAHDCATLIEHSSPGDTVIVSEAFEPDKELLINAIHALRVNDVRVVMITPSMDGLAESALNMGVYDIIPQVGDGSGILEVLKHPRTYAQALKLMPQKSRRPALVPAAGAPVRVVQPEPLTCAFTRAGGAGKSTAIAYLATALLKYGVKAAIIDLDEDKPSVAKILGVNFREGIDSLSIRDLRGDLGMVTAALTRIKNPLKNGLTVYPAGGNVLPFEDEADVYSMYAALHQEHPVVLADLTVRFNDLATLATIRRANKVLFIVEQYQPTLDACVRHVEEARSVGVDTGKYVLVVNKYTENSRITVRKIEESLDMKAAVILPMEPEKYRNEVDAHNPSPGTDEWMKLGALIANTDYRPGKKTNRKRGFPFRLFGRRKQFGAQG